jgi:hypothetical protein
VATRVAFVDVPAQRRCATNLDGPHHTPLLRRHTLAVLAAVLTPVLAEDVCNLYARPVHLGVIGVWVGQYVKRASDILEVLYGDMYVDRGR